MGLHKGLYKKNPSVTSGTSGTSVTTSGMSVITSGTSGTNVTTSGIPLSQVTTSPASGTSDTSGNTSGTSGNTSDVADFSAEQVTTSDFDFSKILGKSEAEIAKEEKATEEGIDQLAKMFENSWNSQAEAQAENEPWKWKDKDSEMLKRTVMALEAKYRFIGKSLNYIPEIMLIALIVNIVMKGLALRKAKSGIPRRSTVESYQSQASDRITMEELNRLAEEEAERVNRERGLS